MGKPKRSARLRRAAGRMVHRLRGRKLVHVLHIDRTGSTAVQLALKKQKSPRFAIYLHKSHMLLSDVPSGEHAVFFLRDPIARFLSGFQVRQRQGRPGKSAAWSPEEKVAFERFDSPNRLALALSSADRAERTAADEAMRAIQHVRSPLREWLVSEEYLRLRADDVLFIGFQEQLEQDVEALRTRLGIDAPVRLPDGAASRAGEAAGRLDERADHNLRHWYAEDYRLLALCRELAAVR